VVAIGLHHRLQGAEMVERAERVGCE